MRERLIHVMTLFLLAQLLAMPAAAQLGCMNTKHGAVARSGGGQVQAWPVDILHQRIELDLTSPGIIRGSCLIQAVPREDGLIEIPLHLLSLTVDSVTTENDMIPFDHNGESLMIQPGAPLYMQDTVSFTVHYHGVPAVDPSGFGGFYTTPTYLYNLGVAFTSVPHSYGRAWFPCVDNFHERNTYEFLVRTNGGKKAWCNGALFAEEQLGGDTLIRHWKKELPIPAYLASVAAANYTVVRDTFPSISSDLIPVELVARSQDTTNMKNSFINLPSAFAHFEEWFGKYRWNKVGYVATPLGAMEHSTSIHYPLPAINGDLQYEKTMAHELAHEWFGNLVTCERAEEMYINEGFAEFLSHLFLEEVYGRQHYMNIVRTNHKKMVHQAHLLDEGWWALAEMPQEWTYGEHSYNKGASVLHSLRGYLGDEAFQTGLTSFLNTYEFQPVNSLMLRDHLSVVTGMELTDFFNDWIFQPGWAAFEVDSFSVDGDQLIIHIQQKLRGANSFYNNVPLTVTLVDAAGEWWQAPERIWAGGEFSTASITAPFTPAAVLLNADGLLNMAVTTQRDTLPQTGSVNFPIANIRFNTEQLPASIPLYVEHYWVAADGDVTDDHAYAISPDRWWRITGNIPEDASIEARIEYDARPVSYGSIDIGLMQDHGSIPFHEDSLVVLYRPDQSWPWSVHPDHTVTTLASQTDGWGRVDINGIRAGEYTLGWRKSAVGISEDPSIAHWSVHPNPAQDHVTVHHMAGPLAGTMELLDQNGRPIRWRSVNADRVEIALQGVAAGSYLIRFQDQNGRSVNVGKVVVR